MLLLHSFLSTTDREIYSSLVCSGYAPGERSFVADRVELMLREFRKLNIGSTVWHSISISITITIMMNSVERGFLVVSWRSFPNGSAYEQCGEWCRMWQCAYWSVPICPHSPSAEQVRHIDSHVAEVVLFSSGTWHTDTHAHTFAHTHTHNCRLVATCFGLLFYD